MPEPEEGGGMRIGPGPGDPLSDELREALEACRDLMPAPPPGASIPEGGPLEAPSG